MSDELMSGSELHRIQGAVYIPLRKAEPLYHHLG